MSVEIGTWYVSSDGKAVIVKEVSRDNRVLVLEYGGTRVVDLIEFTKEYSLVPREEDEVVEIVKPVEYDYGC